MARKLDIDVSPFEAVPLLLAPTFLGAICGYIGGLIGFIGLAILSLPALWVLAFIYGVGSASSGSPVSHFFGGLIPLGLLITSFFGSRYLFN